MENFALPPYVEQWANLVLAWIGFGTLAGLLAKAIMPGRDPGGAITTLLMGIGGVVIGCGVVAFFAPTVRITPMSPVGFLAATAGAFVILLFYRLLAGKIVVEAEDRVGLEPKRRRRRAYRVDAVHADD